MDGSCRQARSIDEDEEEVSLIGRHDMINLAVSQLATGTTTPVSRSLSSYIQHE